MRRLVVAAILALGAQGASAADLPILRGSYSERPVVQRPLWQGFYIGGQATTGSTDTDFTNANQTLQTRANADLARANNPLANTMEWPTLNPRSTKANGYGGFAGYNMQWDDAVVGVEANYFHGRFGTFDSAVLPPQTITANGGQYLVTTGSSADLKISDMGSVRVRGGWSWNGFLPYAFVGVGLGNASYVQNVSLTSVPATGAPPAVPNYSLTDTRNNRLLFGYSAGLGLDMMLVAGLFARVEWEYTKFSSNQLSTALDPTINTVRVGLGYKF